MTPREPDRFDAKARELMDSECPHDRTDHDEIPCVLCLAAAVRAAESEALERAAQLCEDCLADCACSVSIRALKPDSAAAPAAEPTRILLPGLRRGAAPAAETGKAHAPYCCADAKAGGPDHSVDCPHFRALPYQIRICDDCLNLRGKMCNEPSCVFCRRTMQEVGEYLDVLLIRPIIDGKRIDVAEYTPAPAQEAEALKWKDVADKYVLKWDAEKVARVAAEKRIVELEEALRAAMLRLLRDGYGPGGGFYAVGQRLSAAIDLLEVGWGATPQTGEGR